MDVKPELNSFYLQNKRKMDKSNFNNKLPKIYNFLLNNYKDIPNYKNLKEESVEKFKYRISCTNKPGIYDSSYNDAPDYILNNVNQELEKNKKYNEFMDNITTQDSVNIQEYVDTTLDIDISGIQKVIQDLDLEIQEKQVEMNDLEIKNNGKITSSNTLDEFVEKNYQNISTDGTKINNDVNFLLKTQKEIEIYEKIIFILYFLLSSSLGFFYLFKNK